MCIAIFSTAHPAYALVLINNRDEFLTRPTAPLSFHYPSPQPHSTNTHTLILSGRDLLRPAHGTWLGITTTGLLAVLTNFREDHPTPPAPESRSRGEIVNAFLAQPDGRSTSTADFVHELVGDGGKGLEAVGGFTMVCGRVGEALAVVSNRGSIGSGEGKRVEWVLGGQGETVGVSNGGFGDAGWGKVEVGREMVVRVVGRDVERRAKEGGDGDERGFVEELFGVLGHDTLPRRPVGEEGWDGYVKEFRKSIFIPVVGEGEDTESEGEVGMSGVYGTQKQSVVLVDRKGHVTFVERTLYDDEARPVEGGEREKWIEFDIEGWKEK